MTENEIFDAMLDNAWEEHDELLAYRAIGTIEEFKALKEKAEPKKPLRATLNRDMACHCPICMEFVCFEDTHKNNYCEHCGTKLDWT